MFEKNFSKLKNPLGGIIGSGLALQVEKRNKKAKFNRLVPAAATLIQSWWRMKATALLSPSRSSCLAATIGTFDLTKPFVYAKRQNYYRKNYNSLASSLANDEFKTNRNLDEDEPLVNSNQSNRKSSILLKLSPEHLILIRTILCLKYFAAKKNFKSAYKPYDLKDDLIEQYARGNLDILVKIKELQRKFENLTFKSSHVTDQKADLLMFKLNKIECRFIEISKKLDHLVTDPNN